ncbi:hypothetical protein ACW9IK_27995 [Pseudomonas gingeri]
MHADKEMTAIALQYRGSDKTRAGFRENDQAVPVLTELEVVCTGGFDGFPVDADGGWRRII